MMAETLKERHILSTFCIFITGKEKSKEVMLVKKNKKNKKQNPGIETRLQILSQLP